MEGYVQDICVMAVGGALFAWVACRFHQPILVGYFLCGVFLGPWGLGFVRHTELLGPISHIGITLLLFLAGLVLHPEHLVKYFRRASVVTVGGCLITCPMVFGVMFAFGFNSSESLIASLALMFSSTVLAVKLLPTTTLHQRRMGRICIAILIAQDIFAVVLIMMVGLSSQSNLWKFIFVLHAKALFLIVLAVLVEMYVLRKMMRSADRFHEVLIMLCLGWCLGMAALADTLGLSYEIGAFVAGVVMARGKIAFVFSEQLKPLRDFFLMFFFFVLGAEFDLFLAQAIWFPAVLLCALLVITRPVYLRWLLRLQGEEHPFSREVGFRLGQASEFALIVALVALDSGRISERVSQLIQLATVLTMITSSYVVVLKYPTPLGLKPELKED